MLLVRQQHISDSIEPIRRVLRPALFLPILVIFFCGATGALLCQPGIPGEGPRAPGTTGDPAPFDTSAVRDARDRTLESSGLLEQPIDPEQYMIGPNDQLSVSIPTADYKQYDLIVYPDGKLVIPRVGEVDLRKKSLAGARTAIREAVMRYYKVSDVSVSLKKMRQFKVSLIGAVNRPGTVVATPTTRVSEVIDMGGGASPLASKRSITIRRAGRTVDVDLLPFYAGGDLTANPMVEGGDVIQVGVGDKRNVIAIYGAVQRPGEFPYHRGDSISSLVRYAWGFSADARVDSIELVSVNDNGDTLQRSAVSASYDGAISDDRPLRAGDRVFVRRRPEYLRVSQAVIAGEVRSPGTYPIQPGKTKLRELIEGSGGFTPLAAISDAALIRRQGLFERDPKLELILSIDREKRTEDEVEYLRIKSMERPGVMTVNVAALMNGKESENITLIDQDSVFVPSQKDFIKVTGKVKNPGNVTYSPGASYDHYIDLAGGYGWKSDEGNTQIIKNKSGDAFLASSQSKYVLEPGDAILVPEEKPSDFWKGFTTAITVIAQIGTIVAVVVSIAASTKK